MKGVIMTDDVIEHTSLLNHKGEEAHLVNATDLILRQVCEPFDFENPQRDPVEMFQIMRDIMCTQKGIGLAAPQIGLPYRMFVMGNPSERDSCIAVFNPILLGTIDDQIVEYEEGCLTYRGLFLKIKRARAVRVRYTNEKGNTDTTKFDGLTARVFLHELDHLNGILYTKRAHPYHVEKAKKDLKKLIKRRGNAGLFGASHQPISQPVVKA